MSKMFKVDLECPDCKKYFETGWEFDDVQCPICKKWWETDSDTNADDDITGPWISGSAEREKE